MRRTRSPGCGESGQARERVESFGADVRRPSIDGGVDELFHLVRVLGQDERDLRLLLDAQEQRPALARDERTRGDHLALGDQLAQVGAVAVDGLLHALERIPVLECDEGVEGHGSLVSPALGAGETTPAGRSAMRELRLAAAAIPDQPLRAAVEAQLLAPWLPPEAWAVAHPAEVEKLLRAEGLLDAPLALPGQRGSFAAACGGGHHVYPGGLAVHSWTDLLHARGLAEAYEKVYGVKL